MTDEVETPVVAGLPVDSFREAAPYLRRPFTSAAVKWKLQTSWSGGGLVVPYIDARLVIERLNLVCPHLWSEPEYVPLGKSLICKLTVDGITRQDLGSGYEGKGLFSDAFKRAAVKFGVGVSLYALPKLILNDKDGHLERKQKGGKEFVNVTPNGVSRAMEVYELWLDTVGGKHFGAPLDHGDVLEGLGDVEAGDVSVDVPPDYPAPLDDERAMDLIARCRAVYDEIREIDVKALLPGQFHQALSQAQHSHDLLLTLVERLEAQRDHLLENPSLGGS